MSVGGGRAMVLLPDGRNVNVCTSEGATEVFRFYPKFVSIWIAQAKGLLEKAGDPNTHRKSSAAATLSMIMVRLGAMAQSLSPELAAQDTDEFSCLVDFIMLRFSTISDTPIWRSTGTLSKPDQELLDAVVPWLKHPAFVELMLRENGLNVIASLIARDENGKPAMPIPEVTETILMITNNAILTVQGRNNTEQTFIKICKKEMLMQLEQTGLLAQSLRCLTAPARHGSITEYIKIVDILEMDIYMLNKRFAPGQPSGNILQGLLAGTDGWKHVNNSNPDYMLVMQRLASLQKLATMRKSPAWHRQKDVELSRICGHCSRTGLELNQEDGTRRLLACSKCKRTYYCSQECQRADWKQHKEACGPGSNIMKPELPKQPEQKIIMSVIQKHYVAIMTIIKETCETNELDKKEVFIELDFYSDPSSASSGPPALEGKFRIESVRECLKGNRSAEPDWFFRNSSVYQSNVALFREVLMDHSARMTPNHALVVFRGSAGNAGVYLVDMVSETTGFHIMSDEALELFPQDTLEKQLKLRMLQDGHEARPLTTGDNRVDEDEVINKFLRMYGTGELN